MRIAILAHLRHPIGAPFMGGMEAHCHALTLALMARGHAVTLFAAGDSDPALPLHPILARHYEATLPWALWRGSDALSALQSDAFGMACATIADGGFDVVHNNTLHPTPHDWARRGGHPIVTSLHVPPFAGLTEAIARNAAPWLRQTAASGAHLLSWWPQPPATASVVYNGIDAARWPFVAAGNGRALWAGRITPTKGTAVAIDAARAAGFGLDIIGPIDCLDYFNEAVRPRLDAERCHRGPLSGDALAAAMGSASVMIATPLWDEPFGLVVAEAMACGVPVAALDRGAMREVIGEAGALATDPAALPAAIHQAHVAPRAACRARIAQHFSIDAMIAGYEAAYAAAIAASRSNRASTTAVLA